MMLLTQPVAYAQSAQSQQAVPLEPISAIITAFGTHRLVVLGENHFETADQLFRLSLIRDPRFASTVNDIVVESGSAAFQDVMDRFMAGEDVPSLALRQVWLNALSVFHVPIYEEFFRAVREVNDGLPANRRIRVVLGEAPDHQDRDAFVAKVIRREVLDRDRRALVIYGSGHTTRRHPIGRDDVADERTFVTMLEGSGERVFSVWPHPCAELVQVQPSVSAWPRPSLAMVQGTMLGREEFITYAPIPEWRRAPRSLRRNMDDMVDAVLCLAPD